MGCCTTKASSDPAIRKKTDHPHKPEDPHTGKKVTEKLKTEAPHEIIAALKAQEPKMVEAIVVKQGLKDVSEIRGHGITEKFELLGKELFDLSMWNPVLLAVLYKDIASLRYFLEQLHTHPKLALRAPPIAQYSKMQESSPQESECFPLMVAIHNRDKAILTYLWTEQGKLWDNFHLQYVLEVCGRAVYTEGIQIILHSETARLIFKGMGVAEKLEFA